MEIPYQQLSEEALRNLITEFVSRVDESYEHSLESKIEQVMVQLKKGTVVITFDVEDETCFIQTRDSLR